MNDKLMLIADFVEGTWDGVVCAWCEATGQEALCLVPREKQATAYLVVAKDEYQVQEALKGAEASALPLVWVNDYDGRVLRYTSISEALKAVAMKEPF
ncbi:MAG: hypothetical protein ACUVXI_18505 [bacterium]